MIQSSYDLPGWRLRGDRANRELLLVEIDGDFGWPARPRPSAGSPHIRVGPIAWSPRARTNPIASTPARTEAATARPRQRRMLRSSLTNSRTSRALRGDAPRMCASIAGRRSRGGSISGVASSERRQALLPGADRLVEVGLAQPPRRQRRPLARLERAERIFGRGEVIIGRDRHDARQSLSCSKTAMKPGLDRRHGAPGGRFASASRLKPR